MPNAAHPTRADLRENRQIVSRHHTLNRFSWVHRFAFHHVSNLSLAYLSIAVYRVGRSAQQMERDEMKFTLSITGSAAALAAAMKAAEAVDGTTEGNSPSETQTGSTSIGAGTPVAPVSAPSVPSGVAPMPIAPSPSIAPIATTSPDEAEEGDDSDGTGLDSAGLPWDERIHSSSKKRGKDGTWNKRRGGPSGAELAAIENELRGASTPAPVPVAPPQPLPVAPVEPTVMPAPAPMPIAAPMPQPVPMPTPVVEQPVPAAPPPVVEQPVPAAPVDDGQGWDFGKLMSQIAPNLGEGEGQLGNAYLAAVCQMYGIGTLTDLSIKPELIPSIVAQFRADGRM